MVNPISRREVLPALAMGAAAAALNTTTSAEAQAAAVASARYSALAGPSKLRPGHTLSYEVYLPFVQDGPTAPVAFRLSLRDSVTGKEILYYAFQLRPGTGTEVRLALREDGSVTLNERLVPGLSVAVVISIIGILVGLAVPVVLEPRGIVTSLVSGRSPAESTAEYALPFVPHDNLA